MAEPSVLAVLMLIYIVAISGCLSGVLAAVLAFTLSPCPRQVRWLGWFAAAVGALLLVAWILTGERLSLWGSVPIASLGSGVTAVVTYRRHRASLRRYGCRRYRSRRRGRRPMRWAA